MGPGPAVPIEQIQQKKEENRRHFVPRNSAVDRKVQGLVRFPSTKEGILLATEIDPRRMLLSPGEGRVVEKVEWKPKKVHRKRFKVPLGYCPIGLRQNEVPWINALMQFLLFIPSLREMFWFVPKSLQSLGECASVYFRDLANQHDFSSANTGVIAAALLGKFPHLSEIAPGVLNLDDAIGSICKSASGKLLQRPSWQVLWDSKSPLETVLQKKPVAFEWLVSLQKLYDGEARKCPEKLFGQALLHRYYFFHDRCLELDAFIELRPEGGRVGYYTYLKANGSSWVQCADETVTHFRRCRTMEIALQRGIIFHYRQVPYGRSDFLSRA